jgi:signal recognition particle subunit SRP54
LKKKKLFDYTDFIKQLKWIKRIGSLKGILGLIPGIGKQIRNLDIDDKQFVYLEAIIGSMTPDERHRPDLLAKSSSRRMRISKGSGRPYQEVNALIKRFDEMKNQMTALSRMSPDKMQFNKPPAVAPKPKKGKGKGRGNFRF